MSTEIIDLAQYGNMRGRDVFSRNLFQAVKGDGLTASFLTQSFHGIQSATNLKLSLANVTISEGVADDNVGNYTVGVNIGAAVNDVLALSNAASTITSSTINLDTPLVTTDGLIEATKIYQSGGTKKAEVEIVGGDRIHSSHQLQPWGGHGGCCTHGAFGVACKCGRHRSPERERH
ncbi:unnamed protein product [Ectocarpus sp. 4 AP-2014]